MVTQNEPDVSKIDLDEMRAYLTSTDIEFAVLFGSQARGTADESSDVDVAIQFPEEMDERDRFDLRNRIDATIQEYAEHFVDVSDIDSLPVSVAHAALRDGYVLCGDKELVDSYHKKVENEYEATTEERERDKEVFIDRLARGDV